MKYTVIGLILVLAIAIMPANAEMLKVTIHNPNDYDLTDYQVRIDLSGYLDSVGYLKVTNENGNDLKFCYEQANGECGVNPSSVIWVEVPKISANSDAVIYIEKSDRNYAVNGDQVFDFYDDFNDGIVDTNKWSKFIDDNDETIYESNGYLALYERGDNDGVWVRTKHIFETNGIIVELRVKGENVDMDARWGFTLTSIGHLQNNDGIYQCVPTKYDNLDSKERYYHLIGMQRDCLAIGKKLLSQTFENAKFIPKSGKLEAYYCGEHLSSTAIHPYAQGYFTIYQDGSADGGTLFVDYVIIRKYADVEPTITIEEAGPPTPKPKLTLTINCDSKLKQGEIRTAELTVENVGNANAKDITVTIISMSLGINIQKSYDLIPPNEARTISFKVSPNEAGRFTIKAKVEYWDDKGNKYIETTEKTITVEATEIITETTLPTGKGVSTPDFTIPTLITALAIVLALRRLR